MNEELALYPHEARQGGTSVTQALPQNKTGFTRGGSRFFCLEQGGEAYFSLISL